MNPLWLIFVGSIIIVLLLLIKGKIKPGWIALVGLQFVAAGVLLYFINGFFGPSWGLYIPMNVFTLCLVAWLGLPGLALVAALHAFVI